VSALTVITGGVLQVKREVVRPRISPADLAEDRAFWRELLEHRARSDGLPAHAAGGYRNRRFAVIHNAAWITLYRAKMPFPQIGVFLRCTGLAGEAFFALADRARADIEARLQREVGVGAELEWGISHHPGMTDIAAIRAAPLPWDDIAAGKQMAWLLRIGSTWWNCFTSLTGDP
jgi:hypothetical protein